MWEKRDLFVTRMIQFSMFLGPWKTLLPNMNIRQKIISAMYSKRTDLKPANSQRSCLQKWRLNSSMFYKGWWSYSYGGWSRYKIATVFILLTLILLWGFRKWVIMREEKDRDIIVFNLKTWDEQSEPEITDLRFHSLIKQQKGTTTGSWLQGLLLQRQKKVAGRANSKVLGYCWFVTYMLDAGFCEQRIVHNFCGVSSSTF